KKKVTVLSQKGGVEKIREGEGRNQALISFAGTLRSKGVEEKAMLSMLQAYSKAHFEPPLDEHEVMQVWKSIQRYEPGRKIKRKKDTELEKERAEIEALKQMMAEGSEVSDQPSTDQHPLFQKKHVINTTDQPLHILSDQAW